jgi:hypothetical protein
MIRILVLALLLGACGHKPQAPTPLEVSADAYRTCLGERRDCSIERERYVFEASQEHARLLKRNAIAAESAASSASQRNTMAIYNAWTRPGGYTGGW